MKRLLSLLLAFLLFIPLMPADALAQETVDLGTLRDSELQVVQKLLYPKAGRSEFGGGIGAVLFDPYMVAPKIQVTYGSHLSESLGWELQVGAGYGLGTAAYRELRSPGYGVEVEAYRYLASLTGGVDWSPIYAKMNLAGRRIVHHDIYIPIVGGLTVEQLAWGPKHLAFAPTVGVGVGARVFQGDSNVVRIELRDDILVESRKQTSTVAIKQNVGLHLAFSRLGERK